MTHTPREKLIPTTLEWSPNYGEKFDMASVRLGQYFGGPSAPWYVIISGRDDTAIQTMGMSYCEALELYREITSHTVIDDALCRRHFHGSPQNNGWPHPMNPPRTTYRDPGRPHKRHAK